MAIKTDKCFSRKCKQIEEGVTTVVGKVQRMQLLDEKTKEPLKNALCHLVSEDGKLSFYKTSDENGYISHFLKEGYKICIIPHNLARQKKL